MKYDEKLVEAVARAICIGRGMKYDEKLVEAVARAICIGDPDAVLLEQGLTTRPRWTSFTADARRALAAIDASSEWWLAPSKPTGDMVRAADDVSSDA